MGNFKRDGKKSGGGFNRGFGRGKPAMHKATCGECGISCEVPFRPTGERPVFCSNCFKNQGNGGRPNKQMHDAVCAKCGKDCQVPFRPAAGKSIFCDDCFKQDGSGSKDSGEIMEQINLLNAKIDKLMKILTPKVKKEVAIKKVVKKKKKPK